MQTVIGITGEIGSGKDTFSSHFIDLASEKKVVRTRFSDLLKETLTAWSLPHTRHNLQYLAIIMDKEFGEGTLSRAIRERIGRLDADIVLVEGMRWATDVELIRSFPNNMIVYITAPQGVRFERVKKRNEKEGEADVTFSRFQKEDQEPTEIEIPLIGKDADVTIRNDGSIHDFENEVKNIYNHSTLE